jgi:hypothetical protein
MVDSLGAKIGIGEAARRDPVGVRVRSPSQQTPQNNSLSPQRSVNQRRQAPAHGRLRNPKTAECARGARDRQRGGILSNVARARCWDSFLTGSFGSIAGVTWLTPIGHCGSAALACPEKSGQDRPVIDSVVPSSYHSAVSPSGHPGGVPRHAIPRLAPGAALIVALLLSLGLWGTVWLVVSALAAMWPW